VSYLKRTANPDFDRAYFRSGGQSESLVELLGIAADRLEESVALIPEHKNNKDIQAEVKRCTAFFVQIINHFPEIRKQYRISVKQSD
jgi:hypothetical protein